MRDDRRARILGMDRADTARGELDVDVTVTLPKIHPASGVLDHPGAEVLVGHEKNIAIGRRGADNFLRVAAGADDVGERLHPCAAIDVGDDVVILVGAFFKELRELFRRARLGERAPGVEIRQDHFLGRIENFRGLSHEMDAAEKNDFSVGLRSLKAQA